MTNKPKPRSILDGFLNSDDPDHRRYVFLNKALMVAVGIGVVLMMKTIDQRDKLCQSGPGVFLNGTKVACVEYPPRSSCPEGELLVTPGESGSCSICVWRLGQEAQEGQEELRARLQVRDFQMLDPVEELVCLEAEAPELPS